MFWEICMLFLNNEVLFLLLINCDLEFIFIGLLKLFFVVDVVIVKKFKIRLVVRGINGLYMVN